MVEIDGLEIEDLSDGAEILGRMTLSQIAVRWVLAATGFASLVLVEAADEEDEEDEKAKENRDDELRNPRRAIVPL